MITIANYRQHISPEILQSLPESLKTGHEYLMEAGDFYNEDPDIKETLDLYVDKLNQYLSQQKPRPKATKATPKKKKARSKAKPKPQEPIEYIFHQPKDLAFIKRFVNMNGKEKSRHQIGLYIKALQRAIISKEIRKTSAHAGHIIKIQEQLCKQYNQMKEGETITLAIKKEWLKTLETIVNKEKVYRSVMIIKRYIGLSGKQAPDKAATLLKAIESALRRKVITSSDPYFKVIANIQKNLKQAVKGEKIKIEKAELSGLQGIISQYEEDEINGLACQCDGPINSVDFAKLKFKTLGFKGKWKDFIGDPTEGFTALVFGKPKSGKSTLCAQFAGYLAADHGRVLYISKEEGLNGILQERIERVGATHPNLDIDSSIPYDKLKDYDFVVLDSVHKLGLDEAALDEFPKKYPNLKGHLFIMHSTKNGDFRGSQTYAHNVDVLIQVEDGGLATQSGRFAQGSEMQVFNND